MADETPWPVERVGAIFTNVVYESFTCAAGTSFTFTARDGTETYELLPPTGGEGADYDDILTFERESDGTRFDVEFWVNVSVRAEDAAT